MLNRTAKNLAPAAIGGLVLLAAFVAPSRLGNGQFPNVLACYGYPVCSPPTVTNVNPNMGPTAGGTNVTITGTSFSQSTTPVTVSFGGTAATNVGVVDDSHITATSPAHAAGTVDVTVTTSFGTSATSTADQFTYSIFPCTSAGASAAPPSPSSSGTAVVITATSTGCPNPRYQFFTLPPGASSYTIAQPYSASATFNWSTTGLVAGTYRIGVWARDAASAGVFSNSFGTFDASFELQYMLTVNGCTAVGLSGAPPSMTGVGTTVTFTATASCPHASPVFQFFTLAPGASAYTVAQAFSTSNTFSWATTGLKPGGWLIAVWVRDASSPGVFSNSFGTFDASTSISYTLTTCASVSLSGAPPGSAGVGTPVLFTASSTGCPNASPLFQFFTLAPGASAYTIAQPFSTANTFSWTTTGLKPGAWQVAVWVRDASSGGVYSNSFGAFDASISIPFTLTTCASATLSAAPPNTAPHSTTVTFTATAMGCPHTAPLFEFWVLAPGASSWTMSQAYSPLATFAWSAPATPGTYQIVVWVKDTSSGGAAGNSFGTWDVQASYTYTLT